MRQRIRLLEKSLAEMENKRAPEEKTVRECEAVLSLEGLNEETGLYLEWQKDMGDLKERQKEKKKLEQKLLKLKEENVDQWEKERSTLLALGRRQEKRTGRGQPPDLRASYENLPDDPGSHSGGTGAAGKRAGI